MFLIPRQFLSIVVTGNTVYLTSPGLRYKRTGKFQTTIEVQRMLGCRWEDASANPMIYEDSMDKFLELCLPECVSVCLSLRVRIPGCFHHVEPNPTS